MLLSIRHVQVSSLHTRDAVFVAFLSDFYSLFGVLDFWMYKEKIRPILEQIIGDEQIKQSLKVQRSDMYAAAMSHYKGRVSNVRRGSGSIRHESLMILFDDCGVHNYDGGGFRREFHSAFFQTALRDTGLFVGNYPRLVPNYTQDRLDDLTALGIGIVEAILNFDCGFPYLNPGLYYFMAGNEDFEQYLLIDDIPNPAVKYVVNQVLYVQNIILHMYILRSPELIAQVGFSGRLSSVCPSVSHL